MKRISLIIISAISLFLANGCSDYLDINHDPNALAEIKEVKSILPAAEMGIANNLMGWDFGFGGGVWVEYWTQSYTASQFKTMCDYLPQEFSTAYQSMLAQPLLDLQYIRDNSKDDDNKGYYFIAEALSIFAWQVITDVWGDIPYSEALMGVANMHPKQDKQEDIYADLLTRTDNLLAVDLSESFIDGTYDYIYNGDLDKWYQFAGTLKLKLMIRLSETPKYNNAALLTYIQNTDLLASSAKIPGSVWNDDMDGKRHPMREFQAGGANYLSQNIIACKSFFDYLSINEDPRQAKLFTGASKAAFFGDFDSNYDSDGNGTTDDKEAYATSTFTLAAYGNMDLMLMSDWEVNFYVAEVYARAGLAEARTFYEAAVKASLNQHGISDYSILETGYAKWTGGNTEAQIRQIAMQKWVANCNYQHIESFLERNRTKYPPVSDIDIAADRRSAWVNFPAGYLTLSIRGKAMLNGNVPASPIYPLVYISRNINAPSQKANVGEKVWWNQKQGK